MKRKIYRLREQARRALYQRIDFARGDYKPVKRVTQPVGVALSVSLTLTVGAMLSACAIMRVGFDSIIGVLARAGVISLIRVSFMWSVRAMLRVGLVSSSSVMGVALRADVASMLCAVLRRRAPAKPVADIAHYRRGVYYHGHAYRQYRHTQRIPAQLSAVIAHARTGLYAGIAELDG